VRELPAARKTAAGKGIDTTTTTTTTIRSTSTSATTTTTGPGVTVPAVIGLKIAAARAALRAAGLPPVSLNAACNRGTLASQSVVTTTTVKPVKPPETVLTQNPAPGTVLKPGSIVSFTMQACPQ
jgi:beta-lactam-binding protein with PASTA domain